MTANRHPESEELIDLVDGELSPSRAEAVESHIEACDTCRSYVESLRHAFSLLAQDAVPEPPPGFWAYLPDRVRARAKPRRRRLAWILAPGAVAIAAVAVFFWWTGHPQEPGFDSMDLLLAEMSTGEIVESLSDDSDYGDVILESADDEMETLEGYLIEEEDVYDLIDAMSDEEKQKLILEIENLMNTGQVIPEGASRSVTDQSGKEC